MFHFQYSVWWIIPCLCLGVLYAFLLYRKEKSFEEPFLKFKKLKHVLFGLRAIFVSLLALLLLVPLIEHLRSETKKPIVCLVMDQSKSMRYNNDSVSLKKYWDLLKESLKDDYEVKSYQFGGALTADNSNAYFSASSSNISNALQEVGERNAGQAMAGIVLCSDGVYNAGSNPLYSQIEGSAPIYCVGIGDTTKRPDLGWQEIKANKTCFLNDQLNVKAEWKAVQLRANSPNYRLYENVKGKWQLLENRKISLNGSNSTGTVQLILSPKEIGIHHYQLKLDTLNSEQNLFNNTKDFYVEVIEKKQHVLILADAPHPDLAALKNALTDQIGIEAEIVFVNGFNAQKISNYDLVILHGLPSRRNPASDVLSTLKRNNTPSFYIVSSNSNLVALNNAQECVGIRPGGSNANEVQAVFNKDFNHFTVETNVPTAIDNYPPLLVPFADFKIIGDVQVLATQKIGNAKTSYPLLVLGQQQAILLGEGIWRWSMQDKRPENSYGNVCNELINKTCNYLVRHSSRQPFEVNVSKKIYSADELINFDAYLRNESGEYTNTPDVNLKLVDAQKKEYSYVMNKESNTYSLNAGILPSGIYSFAGQCVRNGKTYTSVGAFRIENSEQELQNLVANHGLLKQVANKHQGIFCYPNELQKIVEHLKKQSSSKPIIVSEKKVDPIINLPWILLLIVLIITIEWGLRKYFGAY